MAEEKIERKESVPETKEQKEERFTWTPKTELGKKVLSGEIPSIDVIFDKGLTILEPEIVDYLLPNIEHDIVLIGGSPGKGGGSRRTPSRRTARMHKSGRRFKNSCLVVCGNGDGYVGMGMGKAVEFRSAMEKALKQAKLNIMPVLRGCGSWECTCGTNHSIPSTVEGKEGSVRVTLKPAPKGIGTAVSDEIKKAVKFAGIKDLWIKSSGSTSSRVNHIKALIHALENLNSMKIPEEVKKKTGAVLGC